MDETAPLGKRLKALRENIKLTQADIADFMSSQGRQGYPVVSKIETGSSNTSRATLAVYALLSVISDQQREQAKNIINDLLSEK